MNQERIAHNLRIVDRHFEFETIDVEAAVDLYTEDVAWEWPSRRITLRGKVAVAENYRRLFAAMTDLAVETHERFATADRVVDDSTLRFTRMGNGATAAGTPVKMRLLHVFHMRDGKIARELVFDA